MGDDKNAKPTGEAFKLFEIRTKCGTLIQVGKLLDMERNLGLTNCPIRCPACGSPHGLERVVSIHEVTEYIAEEES